jgi:hypothetical protein
MKGEKHMSKHAIGTHHTEVRVIYRDQCGKVYNIFAMDLHEMKAGKTSRMERALRSLRELDKTFASWKNTTKEIEIADLMWNGIRWIEFQSVKTPY